MSDDRWNTILVLGGIRSGKSAFAESLVADAPAVRYVATAVGGEDDPEWLSRIEAHQRRRPQSWSTQETGADPALLTELLAGAQAGETLLVDDLGGWVAAVLDPARQPNDDEADVAALAAAVRACRARVVLVSPEVGLALVPATPIGRAFADALGSTNQALAAACDGVALVVAGQAIWLKSAPAPARVVPAAVPAAEAPVSAREDLPAEPAALVAAPTDAADVEFAPAMDLPMPDGDTGPEARERLLSVDFPRGGLGTLAAAVEFAAATQATVTPAPWSAVRAVLVSASYAGGAAAGDDPADVERRIAEAERGEGTLARLAGEAGVELTVARTAAGGAMEDGPVTDDAAVDAALRQGWGLAQAAADDGRDALLLAAIGAGTDAVATAVSAASTGAEFVAILPRVLTPGGRIDDEAWMARCVAVRDALHRIRHEPRGAHDLLRELGGPALALAVGLTLGAASRRLPLLLDGPVGIAAGLIARDFGAQARHWSLLPDAGGLALVEQGADVLGVNPVLDLGLGLGEGANALAALPLLRTAIALASATPVHPALGA